MLVFETVFVRHYSESLLLFPSSMSVKRGTRQTGFTFSPNHCEARDSWCAFGGLSSFWSGPFLKTGTRSRRCGPYLSSLLRDSSLNWHLLYGIPGEQKRSSRLQSLSFSRCLWIVLQVEVILHSWCLKRSLGLNNFLKIIRWLEVLTLKTKGGRIFECPLGTILHLGPCEFHKLWSALISPKVKHSKQCGWG